MINSVMRIDCSECNSTGLIFFGDNNNYDVETCDCDFGKEQDLFFN
jgi:hypothetical protein